MSDRFAAGPASQQDEASGWPRRSGPPEIYQNEFAMVEVSRYETESGARLCIRDLASGNSVFLDPLELEALTRARHKDFAPLVDPSDLVSTPEPDPDEV
ncbi:hypothetical protein MOQ72_26510 [Saccharopolyspora sp. K220]|uniref:hypothetical protein n=1 Tax=Saccharopolyspora soli TaxID=2926618 RepID=UPI001F5AEDB0|nr:hypothetical protein [Saccharopolyspora soli]MCI2421001.1 hypothetical protein [Saccharopolyspora soli]